MRQREQNSRKTPHNGLKDARLYGPPSLREVTQLLVAWSEGDQGAVERLVPLVEAELRRLAHRYMNEGRPGHVLQTTVLISEAYLRLVDLTQVHWQNRAHFLAAPPK